MGRDHTTPEGAEKLMSQIRRATESGAEDATINALGAQLVFSSQPDGGVAFQAPDGSASSRLYQVSESRPTGYPDDMPFVPKEPVSVSATAKAVTLMWFMPTDPEALFANLNERTKSEGRALNEGSEQGPESVHHSEYETKGFTRSVLLSGIMVSLIQRRL